MASTSTIVGTSPISGQVQGSWKQGLSSYDLAVRYQGFRGTVTEYLESLKGSSVVIKSIEDIDDGVKIILEDKDGEHELILHNGEKGEAGEDGYSPIVNIEVAEGGHNLVVEDKNGSTSVFIPNGEKGDQGEQGLDGKNCVLMCDRDGVVYWRYSEDDDNWKQLIDLGYFAEKEFDKALENHQNIVFCDELPPPEQADPNILYILREDGD